MELSEQVPASPLPSHHPYRFILPSFEGPLDLLLHLIRINEVDITDIPVVEIARQYDAMLDLMRELNLDVAGEFLVMAATLIYIKSKMVLPVDQERIEQGLEEDPRADLTRALIEHQRFRQAAEKLAEREQLAALVFTRGTIDEIEAEGYLEVSIENLVRALRGVVENAGNRVSMHVRRLELPMETIIDRILERLEHEDLIGFSTLLSEEDTLEAMVVTFLAILELVRRGSIRAYQSRPFDEIRLRRGEGS